MEQCEARTFLERSTMASKLTRSHSPVARPVKSRWSLLVLGLIFAAALGILIMVFRGFPKLKDEELQHMKLPTNIQDAKNLARVLSNYKTDHYYQVLLSVIATYIFLQTFAVPGSIFLSIISGFLFSFYYALALVCICSAIGATFCYLLSYLVGRALVQKYAAERFAKWALQVQEQRSNLFNYILFLRITPFVPNWLINLASPLLDVPLKPFFLGTLFGVLPPSCVAVNAGTTLYQLASETEAFSMKSIVFLAVTAIAAILPVFFKHQLSRKLTGANAPAS